MIGGGGFSTTKVKDKKDPVYVVARRVHHLKKGLGLEVQVSGPVFDCTYCSSSLDAGDWPEETHGEC